MRGRIPAVLVAMLLLCAPLRSMAQFQGVHSLSEARTRIAMDALLADPRMPMSEDPSCKADLSRPGSVSVSQALSEALARATTSRPARSVRLEGFTREGYPLAEGQEYCRLAFVPANRPRDGGFGIVFLMDWTSKTVVAGSAECY